MAKEAQGGGSLVCPCGRLRLAAVGWTRARRVAGESDRLNAALFERHARTHAATTIQNPRSRSHAVTLDWWLPARWMHALDGAMVALVSQTVANSSLSACTKPQKDAQKGAQALVRAETARSARTVRSPLTSRTFVKIRDPRARMSV